MLIGLLVVGVWAFRTYRHAMQLRDHAAGLMALDVAHLDDLGPRFALIQDDVALLRRDLTIPLAIAPYLVWVPRYGPTVAAAPDLFDAGELMLGAGLTVWDVAAEPIIGLTAGDMALEDFVPALVARIEGRRADLDRSADAVRQACDLLDAMDAERLHPRLGEPLARVQPALPLAVGVCEALPLLPRIAGSGEAQTWLFLVQNSDELRPSGGFISSIGVATIEDGALRDWTLQDSYRFENWEAPHPDPPQPMRDHMGLDLWVTRDGNWWPDFPTSARAVSELYEINQGTPVDGVVAVDMHAASMFLDAMAPLSLPNDQRIARGQALDVLRRSWGLPEGSLITDGATITATQPYSTIVVSQQFDHRTGTAWFDDVVVARQGDETNLVRNPSYEDDADGDGLPDAWETVGFVAGDGVTTDVAYKGQRSLCLVGDPEGTKSITQRINVTGIKGDQFHISSMSKADGVAVKGKAYALSVYFEGAVEQNLYLLDYAALTHGWASAGSNAILGEWWTHRKDIINHAVGAAVTKLTGDPMSIRWLDMLDAVVQAVEGRHIQGYAADDEIAALLARHGWDGAMVGAETALGTDVLCIVDANVGYNKVTPNVDQHAEYTVRMTDERRLHARLVICYTNTSPPSDVPCNKYQQYTPTYEALAQGCYWDYVRVYVPLGSELLLGEGGDEPVQVFSELGHTALATSFMLQPGETRELVLAYLLPAATMHDGVYTLTLQKQAGVRRLPCVVTVEAPGQMLRPAPPPDALDPGRAAWEIDLVGTQRLVVTLEP